MKRAPKLAVLARTDSTPSPAAPVVAAKPYSGYVVHTAHSDGPGWFSVEMFRQVDSNSMYEDPADPLVTIAIDRRHANLVGDPRQHSTDHIESIRASDVEDLIAQLTDVLAAARATGMLPPPIEPRAMYEHRKARREAIEARERAQA